MSPSPADVGYRCNSHNTGRSRELGALLSSKGAGIRRDESSGGGSQERSGSGGGGRGRGRGGGACSQECSAEPGVPSRPSPSSTSSSSGPGGLVGSGPGNMPSSISVQELKQMTALRMAHEQGRMRVFSPFRFSGGDGGGEQQQSSSRGPSPLKAELDRETRESGGSSVSNSGNAFQARKQSSRDPGGGSAHGDNLQRPRGQRLESLTAGSGGGVAGHSPAPGDIPQTPSSSSSGSSRSGGQRSRRSPSPQGRQSSPPLPLQGSGALSSGSSSSKANPPSSMPHGLTVQELKELTKMRLAREAFNIPVYAVLQSSSQHPPDAKRGSGGSASRGRWASSPAFKSGRHWERSSTPASPGNGDRPHRRTRRGGRRGRNRSPRPDENLSPKRLSGGSAGEGFSSASPSRRLRRTLSDPWGALDDDHHRSSSQPRAVMGRDHVFPGVNYSSEGGDVGDGEADSPVDDGDPKGGNISQDDGSEKGDRGGEFGNAASGGTPEVSLAVGACGTGSPSNSGHDVYNGLTSGSAALTSRLDASGFGARGQSLIPDGLSRRRPPATLSTPAAACSAASFDRTAGGFERERERKLELDRALSSERAKPTQYVERRDGCERERERKLELDRALSSERAKPTQYVDRRDIAQHARYREKTEGGGGRRVAGMIGPERTTILRGLDTLKDHASQPPGHHRLTLHRASSESVVIPTDRDGRATSVPRYGNPQNQHRRASSAHLHAPETGGGGGIVIGGSGSGGRGRGRVVGGGQYLYEHYEPQEQRRHHVHRSSSGGGIDLTPNGVSPVLIGGGGFEVDHAGSLVDSQPEQHQQHAPGSWDGDSSLRLSPQSLPPQARCLSYRRSDGGGVGSGRGGSRRGFSGAGIICRGGLSSPSSSSPTDGIPDDISFTVAESVLMTSKNPAPPGQWKANHTQQSAVTAASTGAGAAWCVPALTGGVMLTSPSSGMLEREPPEYRAERSQHAYRSSSGAEATVGDSGSGNGFRGPLNLHQRPRPSHQPLGPPKTYWNGGVRDSSNNPPPPGFGGSARFDSSPSQRRGMGVGEAERQQQQPDPQCRPSSSFLSQSPMRAARARYSGSRSNSSVPAPFRRDSFSAVEGQAAAAAKAKGGNRSEGSTTGSSCSGGSGCSSRTPSPSVAGAIGCVTASNSARPSAASGLGCSGGSGGGTSPLTAGLKFSLELAGCAGELSRGDDAQVYRVGGALSDAAPCAHDSRGRSYSGSYSGSESIGFEFAVHGRERLVGASPGSLHGSSGLGRETPSQPRRVDIRPSLAGVEEAVTTARRLGRSVSSTTPVGHGRPAGHPGTIGSSRSRGRGVSGHSSPAPGANINMGVVNAALRMPGAAGARGGGGGDALGSISVGEFLGVC